MDAHVPQRPQVGRLALGRGGKPTPESNFGEQLLGKIANRSAQKLDPCIREDVPVRRGLWIG